MQDGKNKEDPVSGECSNRSMLETLTEHYHWTIERGNGGHMTGFYSKIQEKVRSEYIFPEGKFTLRRVEGRFCRWDYDPFI